MTTRMTSRGYTEDIFQIYQTYIAVFAAPEAL